MIVDLRQPLDVEALPYMIPGALRMAMEELEKRHEEIPRDRDMVLYCSWPNEATSARVALLLQKKGITRVRPLAGGIDAWLANQFPFEARDPVKTLGLISPLSRKTNFGSWHYWFILNKATISESRGNFFRKRISLWKSAGFVWPELYIVHIPARANNPAQFLRHYPFGEKQSHL
jgi:rhodanese-related sulfurtransferase